MLHRFQQSLKRRNPSLKGHRSSSSQNSLTRISNPSSTTTTSAYAEPSRTTMTTGRNNTNATTSDDAMEGGTYQQTSSSPSFAQTSHHPQQEHQEQYQHQQHQVNGIHCNNNDFSSQSRQQQQEQQQQMRRPVQKASSFYHDAMEENPNANDVEQEYIRYLSSTTTTTTTTTTETTRTRPTAYSNPAAASVVAENSPPPPQQQLQEQDDRINYALLVALYTLQGIPMGLSASIPFLIQQKLQAISSFSTASAAAAGGAMAAAAAEAAASTSSSQDVVAAATQLSYKANAIFALCSWPFSLKLLWAPIVDACFFKQFGRRKSWLVPVQAIAGIMMVVGANFVEQQLGLESPFLSSSSNGAAAAALPAFNVNGVTVFFFVLYFLMATQDIAVDGWALTMLSKKNRGKGPICNSIGQNIGYFLSFVGFLALNDVESSELFWRPLLRLPSNPQRGLVSLGNFIQYMGYFMLATTTAVALFKREVSPVAAASAPYETITTTPTTNKNYSQTSLSFMNHQSTRKNGSSSHNRNDSGGMPQSSEVWLKSDRLQSFPGSSYNNGQYGHGANGKDADDKDNDEEEDHELDASEIGLQETYRRLWAVCQLPAVQSLFLILLTYRLPTALNDNVKFLKAVEYGLSKSTTALLSPTVILPLGILVPLLASKVWHGHPLTQFLTAYQFRVTLVPLLDLWMLWMLQKQPQTVSSPAAGGAASMPLQQPFPHHHHSGFLFWVSVVTSTAAQAIVSSLQFNAQMVFFAHRVDPAIGGSYMTLLNTAANLGATYPASFVMWLVGLLTRPATCETTADGRNSVCTGGRDPYFGLQIAFSVLGCLWIAVMGRHVHRVAQLPEDAWRTHYLEQGNPNPDGTTTTNNISNNHPNQETQGGDGERQDAYNHLSNNNNMNNNNNHPSNNHSRTVGRRTYSSFYDEEASNQLPPLSSSSLSSFSAQQQQQTTVTPPSTLLESAGSLAQRLFYREKDSKHE